MAQLIKTLRLGNILGESVIWDSFRNKICWLDILGKKIYRYCLDFDSLEEFQLPDMASSIGLMSLEGAVDNDEYVVSFVNYIAIYDVVKGSMKVVSHLPVENGARLNDGRVGPDSKFWVGGVVSEKDLESGGEMERLYRIHPGGDYDQMLSGIGISNSLCWMEKYGSYMLHSDSRFKKIDKYEYCNKNNSLNYLGVFTSALEGYPDGACVSADGVVFVAEWGAGCVGVFDYQGVRIDSIKVPAKQPTCVAFCGKFLDILAVTSASIGVQSSIYDGDLFLFKTKYAGRLEYLFGQ